MKSAYIAILLTGTLASVMAGGDTSYFQEVIAKCKEDEQVEDSVLEDMKATHELNSDGAKRLCRCVLTVTGIMKDGKFDKVTYVKLAEQALAGDVDEEMRVAMAKEIAEACDGKIGAGGATPDDTAKIIHDCVKEEALKRGVFNIGKLEDA